VVVGAVVTFLDISKRRQDEERIQTLSQAIEQSPVSVVITDPEANIQYVNRTFEQVSGYSSAEVIGQNTRILKSGITSKETYHGLWQTISSGKAWQGEFQNRRKNGELFWEHAHIAPVLDRSVAISHYLAVKEDVTLRKQQEEHILHQAHFDTLTDLPNRLLSLDRLSQLLREAQRNSNKRVFDLMMQNGTSQSPFCNRSLTAYYCPGRPACAPRSHIIASSMPATQHSHKWLVATFGCALCFPFGARHAG